MKSLFVAASLAACALARLNISSPSPNQVFDYRGDFSVEIQETDPPPGWASVAITISLSYCGNKCERDSHLQNATVLYHGQFNPQRTSSQPNLGLFEDFIGAFPDGWPQGGSVLSLSGLYTAGTEPRMAWNYAQHYIQVTKLY